MKPKVKVMDYNNEDVQDVMRTKNRVKEKRLERKAAQNATCNPRPQRAGDVIKNLPKKYRGISID